MGGFAFISKLPVRQESLPTLIIFGRAFSKLPVRQES